MARASFVKKSRVQRVDCKTGNIIPIGESYYHWKFKFGPLMCSVRRPKRQDLTQSGFNKALYDVEDDIAGLDADDSLSDRLEEIKSNVESLRDECQESLDNMPDHLQEESDSGCLLQERIDGLECWQDELESIEIDISEVDRDDIPCLEDMTEEEIEEELEELETAKYQEFVDQIQDICHDL